MATQVKHTSTVRWTDTYTRNMADHIAKMSGQSINGVVMTAIRYYGEHFLAERKQALSDFGPIVLSANDYAFLMETLKNPPKPNASLKKGFARLKKMNIKRKGF